MHLCPSTKILFIEACNFVNAPQGGQLTAARMLMKAFGEQIALCGWTDDPKVSLGVWQKRRIDGVEFDFFATAFVSSNQPKCPFLPARLTAWWQFKRYARAILSSGIRIVLTREPVVMMALPFRSEHRVFFWFPGIEPALSVSRYAWAKRFSSLFDHHLNRKLRKHAFVLLAAADAEAIISLKRRANGMLDGFDIRTFPTRVDTSVFHPCDEACERGAKKKMLDIPVATELLIVTSGRLHRVKGWSLLLDAFEEFRKWHPTAHLVFVGDGSDRKALEQAVHDKKITHAVSLVGFQSQEKLAVYLQAADLFVMGSEKEGWCTSLVEALACGLPIVTTRFSGADTLVHDGVNGFVVSRDPMEFAGAMERALHLSHVHEYSREAIPSYALCNLRHDVTSLLGV